jgi:hypothetical protein
MLLAYSSAGGEPPVMVALAACFLVAPALLAARAEKAVLRMIATESAIFVTLDIVLSPSFVRRRRCDGTPDKIDKRSRYSRRDKNCASFQITFSSPVNEACRRIFSCHSETTVTFSDIHPHVHLAREPELLANLFEVDSTPEDGATKLECYFRCNSTSPTGYRLPELLEFFNRMSIAGLDCPITGLPIQ